MVKMLRIDKNPLNRSGDKTRLIIKKREGEMFGPKHKHKSDAELTMGQKNEVQKQKKRAEN